MKYGIITHYDVHNHGAILQMNALIKVLKRDFNIDAQALRFDKNYDFMGRALKAKYEIGIKSIGIYIKYLLERGPKIFLFNVKKKRLFEHFKSRENLIGEFYSEAKDLDAVVIGSDEVFALHTGPTPALFGHALPADKVFAYAGCFGPTTLDEIRRLHCEPLVASGLSSMQGLGMRDQNSIVIAETLTGKQATLVVDPVILYGYEEEMARLSDPQLPKYLLVYAYETRMNDPREAQPILDYAHSRGLKVVCPGFFHKWADININTDPVELLRYFKYADCVVTDTFHGSVMSIITGKDLAVKLRDNSNKLLNLLQEYGLQERVITDDWDLNAIFSKPQDHEFVAKEVERRRLESMAYLREMVEK
ncbi:MAG: polysaccharide pyruvyl transferase family protein [Lepagella sp.]